MEPTNAELYRLALTDAPYVIGAYGVLWVSFVVYVTMTLRRVMRLEKAVVVVEEALARRDA